MSLSNGLDNDNDIDLSVPIWQEIDINIDWGTIRGKQLGNGPRKVLAVHGWLDNANSFDLVAPYIETDNTIISIDLPGHGLSDHFPPGFVYDCRSYVGTIKKLIDKLGWKTFTYLGHSLGAIVGIIYAVVFPENVNSLISIDIIKPWSLKPEEYASTLRKDFSNYFKNESHSKKKPLEYEEEELLQKILSQSKSLDLESAKILLKRGVKQSPCGSKIILTRDLRVKAFFIGFVPFDVWYAFAKSIKCPILIIKAKAGRNYESPEDYKIMLNAFEDGSECFQYYEFDEKHHLHLTNPKLVGPIFRDFFNISKLHAEKMEEDYDALKKLKK